MDPLTQIEISIVLFFQSLGEWVKTPMQFFTFLGTETFYMVLLPLVYWCIDSRLGLHIATMTVFSNLGVNSLKFLFQSPRPFWLDAAVQPWTSETSFGMPSGHASNAASTWGVIAVFLRRKWVSVVIISLIFLIGISRVYLGVHFVSQILAGWLLGGLILLLFWQIQSPIIKWFLKFSISAQIGLIFLSSVLLIIIYLAFYQLAAGWQAPPSWIQLGSRPLEGESFNPVNPEGVFTLAGTWFGGMAGAAWYYHRYGLLNTSGSVIQKVLRYLLGVIILFGLWYGLGAVFPRTPTIDAYLLRFLRYSIISLWMTVFAPWVFTTIGLLKTKK